MATGRDSYHGAQSVWRSLGARLMLFLSLALLPLGLVAFVQTRDLGHEVRAREELSLLALTQRAASGERLVVERAFGAAEAMGTVTQMLRADASACRSYLQRYVARTEIYGFVGLLERDGRMTCSSFAGILDYGNDPGLAPLMARAAPAVFLEESPRFSDAPVLIVAVPVAQDRAAAASDPLYTMVSVPRGALAEQQDLYDVQRRPLDLVTFNAAGEIMTGGADDGDPASVLPSNRSLAAFVGGPATTFVAASEAGEERIFSIVPLVPGAYYAMGVWDPRLAPGLAPGLPIPPGLLPILMWLASLTVVFLAVHRLVIRHMRQLGRDMRRFAVDRHLPAEPGGTGAAGEIHEMEMDFHKMATALLEDEAALENSVREKNILLKEVYHRVKNNLQLISSIMNMHIRAATAPETQTVLRGLQDRILGLATVHRNLYQSQLLSRTNAAILLREIVGQVQVSANGGVVFETDLEDLALFPDQAVPASLLTAELCHRALHRIDRAAHDPAVIRVGLRLVSAGVAELSVAHGPVSPGVAGDPAAERLEAQLVRAFVMQLGGDVQQIAATNRTDLFRLRFTLSDLSEAPVDF